MKDKFDQMTKDLAQSVTRRGALKRFSLGVIGIALASLGLANGAEAGQPRCKTSADCGGGYLCWSGHCTQPTLNKCNKCAYPYGCADGDTACVGACDNFCSRTRTTSPSAWSRSRGFWTRH